MQKILFPYTKDTFFGSSDTEPVSCICIADPNFMYRAQPCLVDVGVHNVLGLEDVVDAFSLPLPLAQ